MNKETRQFIYGLLMLFLGVIGIVIYFHKIWHGDHYWTNYLFVAFGVCTTFTGTKYIDKAI